MRLRAASFALAALLLMQRGAVAQNSERELAGHVDFAIERAVGRLYAAQKPDGSFEPGETFSPEQPGVTALCVLALHAAGEPFTREEMRRAVAFLRKTGTESTYSLSLKIAALSQLPGADKDPALRRDVARLITMQIDRGAHRGLYSYGPVKGEFTFGDLSNAQYGVLGVWYAAEAGLEVPRGYWERTEQAWAEAQLADGGFAYRPELAQGSRRGLEGVGSGAYGSMTAAGVATLAITHDFLHAASNAERTRTRSRSSEGAKRAVEWLDRYVLYDRNPGRDASLGRVADLRDRRTLSAIGSGSYVHYMLFGYERVGEATGLTRLAGRRWFDEGARYLVATQSASGAWEKGSFGGVIDTAYAVLFLSRGRAPVVIQKLKFDGDWNNRTRDAAALTRWLRRQTERHVNWQIVELDAVNPGEAMRDLRQSPIVYLASDKALSLTDEQVALLKRYIDEGGLLLAADEGRGTGGASGGGSGGGGGGGGGGGAFGKSFEALMERMYPQYVFRDLPKSHPLFEGNFPTEGLDVKVRGMGNGVRELAVLLPEGDFPWRWQRMMGNASLRNPDFSLAGNLLLHVTNRGDLRFKGTSPIVDRDDKPAPATKWTLARVRHSGNFDAEPAAWTQLANRLHNDGVATLEVLTLPPAALDPKATPLAVFSATHPVPPGDGEKAALAAYVRGGGTLLLEAAGGGEDVGAMLDTLARTLLPEAKGTLRTLPADDALLAGAVNGSGQATYRAAAVDRAGARLALSRLKAVMVGGRPGVILATEDLSSALVPVLHDGIVGYAPETARAVVVNLLRATQGAR